MSALWAYTGPPDPVLTARMGAALAHRAPRGESVVDTAAEASIGVTSNDRALGGICKPFAASGATVAFAGRVSPLERKAFVAAAASEGIEGASRFGGEWILAVRTADRLLVGRDAAGCRTAYWAEHDGRVLVAIEPKAVSSAPGFAKRVDPISVVQYLAFSFVPGERCALEGLRELPAGHLLDIDLRTGRVSVRRWFCHEAIEAEPSEPGAWVAATRAAVDAAVEARMPDGPVSTFLSGGLDSSLVTAAAARSCRQRGGSPPVSWSLHFGERYPNEVEFASAVADATGTRHEIVEVSATTVAADLPRLVWHLDEPIGDPVTAGNFALAAAAQHVSPWVLNGEGGDPVFGGPKNVPMLLEHWYRATSDTAFRAERYVATWRRAAEEIEELVHPDLLATVDLHEALEGVVEPLLHAPRPDTFLNKLMVANMRLKGAHLILPKVDRMLGAYGMVPLSPLFDPNVIDLSLRMPPAAKLRHGVEKWVLKQAYADLLPPEIIARPKSGMRVPVQWWFQRELKPLARELLSTRAVKKAGIFRPERVREIRKYRTGRDGLRLWMLVTFELWRRIVIEGETP